MIIYSQASRRLEEQCFSRKVDQGFLRMDDSSSRACRSKNINRQGSSRSGFNEEQNSLSEHPFEKTEKTLFELANADRLLILSQLREANNTLSGLSRQLGMVVQEVHRNINRLVEASLVKKESGNSYSITTLGDTILMQLSSIKFLADNNNYFLEHSLAALPAKFVQRIGALVDSSFQDNPVAVFEYQKELIDDTQEYLDVALSQVPSYLIEYVQPTLKRRHVKLRYLLPLNAVMPKKRHTATAHAEFHQLLQEGVVERRMVKSVVVGTLINEKQAILTFSGAKSEVDVGSCFYSENEQFHEWCTDYFDYMWRQSRPFESKKLVEV